MKDTPLSHAIDLKAIPPTKFSVSLLGLRVTMVHPLVGEVSFDTTEKLAERMRGFDDDGWRLFMERMNDEIFQKHFDWLMEGITRGDGAAPRGFLP